MSVVVSAAAPGLTAQMYEAVTEPEVNPVHKLITG